MKKLLSIIIILTLLTSGLCSCRKEKDAYSILYEIVSSCGWEGVIYSPSIAEGNDGYIRDGLLEQIYLFSGDFPEDYAVFLNSHPDFFSECGVFICSDAEMIGMVDEMCIERIRLLCQGDTRGFVKRSRNIVFYSTMKDRKDVEKIFNETIR